MVCKATHGILRLINKGGTAFPGRLALRICPDILKIVARRVKVIAVTGTNGKTTSVRMAETALSNAGLSVFSNRSGANLIDGITCEFIVNTNFFLRPRCEWAVIECDEAAARRVFGEIKPIAVLVTNLFRDQLDRYGTVTTPRDTIAEGLKSSPETTVCLNADCQLAASIAARVPNKVLYYGFSQGGKSAVESGEDSRCVSCGAQLDYSYVTYANLGKYRCSKCGEKRPDTQITVSDVLSDGSFVLSANGAKALCRPALQGLYNSYNAAGVTALITAAGIKAEHAISAVSNFECGFGRMEEFALGNAGARMILIKNAAAADQTLDIIKNSGRKMSVAFVINDRPADGTDISWIYDADFGRLARMKRLCNVYAAGDRAQTMAERLEQDGVSCEVFKSYDKLIKRLEGEDSYVFILPTYTAMLELRQKLVRRLGGKNFWE